MKEADSEQAGTGSSRQPQAKEHRAGGSVWPASPDQDRRGLPRKSRRASIRSNRFAAPPGAQAGDGACRVREAEPVNALLRRPRAVRLFIQRQVFFTTRAPCRKVLRIRPALARREVDRA